MHKVLHPLQGFGDSPLDLFEDCAQLCLVLGLDCIFNYRVTTLQVPEISAEVGVAM